jgi:exopolysaccharide biosynthesis polyprenyl glycosylphosphotransferase
VNKQTRVILYVLFDFLTAALSWAAFYIYRKIQVEPDVFGYKIPLELGTRFYLGIIIIPIFWLTLYYLSGAYQDVLRKSKLRELGQTLVIVLTGAVILFFALILDDVIVSYKDYYSSFFILASIQFILTYIPRLILTSNTAKQIQRDRIRFNTLMIGSNGRALEIYKEFEEKNNNTGNRIIGFLNGNSQEEYLLESKVNHLGSVSDVRQVVEEHQIEEVIIALDTTEHKAVSEIINTLSGTQVVIKASPDIHDILTGKVKVRSIFGLPLIEITHALMPVWQENLKRVIDVLFSLVALVLFLPLIIVLIFGVKLSSRGPVILRQERIGRYGRPFTLYKFRSMIADAEKNGPELAKKNDDRITNFGKFMRQRKMDEIPNFINVIKGEMSLVGPRPERKFFIDQIVEKAPHYVHLHKVKPGITSWGQVKYGYAGTVDEMLKRLKYDLLYIENMSLFVDLQILIYTLLAIFKKENI